MNDLPKILEQPFRDKDYRHGYVDEFLNASIATQIKVLREQRGWTQKELANHAGMMQPRISAMENVNYSAWNIKTLKSLAEAFDLTLSVSFEGFGTRLMDIGNFSRKKLERSSFEDDPYFKGSIEDNGVTLDNQHYHNSSEEETTSNVYYLKDHISKASALHDTNVAGLSTADSNAFNFQQTG